MFNYQHGKDSKIPALITARNNLAHYVPQSKFVACASWKCSSTYWQHFAEALRNLTESDAIIEDRLRQVSLIKGTLVNIRLKSRI